MLYSKHTVTLVLPLLILGVLTTSLPGQQEVWVGIREGMPMIPVALPDFQLVGSERTDPGISREIYQALWDDLQFSRVFRLIPREHFSYIAAFNPDSIRFKDWASLQANILIAGRVEMSGEDRIVFSVKVYEVNSEKLIFGRNFGGKVKFRRLMAHRAADEMMKYFGERPLFTSKIVFVSDRSGNEEIYMMDYDGKRVTRITYNDSLDGFPAWGSDNEKVMYTSYRNNNPDLYLFHLYSGKIETLATRGANYAADWSLEGDLVAYTSTRSGNAEIYVRDMKSGREKRLTFNPAIDTTPYWSPNSREIAFTSQRSGTPQIYIMDAEGTNVRRITFEGTYHDSPCWSPDGTRIAYVSRIEARFDIYVYHLKSNTITKLTEFSGRNENPSWSPDGRHLVFSSTRGGGYQLYLVDYDGRNVRRLTSRGENKMPNWQKSVR